jgi:hypothetical protein
MHVLEGGGHSPHSEALVAEECGKAVRAFLSLVVRRGVTVCLR